MLKLNYYPPARIYNRNSVVRNCAVLRVAVLELGGIVWYCAQFTGLAIAHKYSPLALETLHPAVF